jgi:hypothetical protein
VKTTLIVVGAVLVVAAALSRKTGRAGLRVLMRAARTGG